MLYLGCMVVLRHDHDDKCCMAGHNLDMVLDTCILDNFQCLIHIVFYFNVTGRECLYFFWFFSLYVCIDKG